MAYSPKRKKKRGSSDARSSTASADGASEMDGAFNFSEVGGSKADGEVGILREGWNISLSVNTRLTVASPHAG